MVPDKAFNSNDEHSRTAHGQYHHWQRQPGDDLRARDAAKHQAARHQNQPRRLWPREGWWSRLADRLLLTDLPRKADVEVSDVQKTWQNPDLQDSGSFSPGASRLGCASSCFTKTLFPNIRIPMTTCRVFAIRWQRASVGLHPLHSPVIGSLTMGGSNAVGSLRTATIC